MPRLNLTFNTSHSTFYTLYIREISEIRVRPPILKTDSRSPSASDKGLATLLQPYQTKKKYQIVIPSSRNTVFKSQNLTPNALHASGIFTLRLHIGSAVSFVTSVYPLAAAVATR